MRKLFIALVALALVGGCSDTTASSVEPGPVNTATASRGVTQGGAQDIGRFRSIVEQGEVPAPDTLDPVGYFAEHAIDLPPAECGDAVCVHPFLGVMPTFDGGNWTMAYVGMNTAVDPSTIERPPLHAVVVIETTGQTAPWLTDFSGLLSALTEELRPVDLLSLVTYAERAEVRYAGLAHDDPEAALESVTEVGDRAALYDGLALAADTLESTAHDGAGRIVLVTSGRTDAGLRGDDRVLELGAALARSGVSLSVLGVGDDYLDEVPAALGSLGAGTYSYASDSEDLRTLFSIEGRTSFAPLATDFEMRVVAADGYAVGDVYGARSAVATSTEALLSSPVLMVGNRTGSTDVDEGRRGGGGGLFVRLYADPDASLRIGGGQEAFTVLTRWTDPVSGEVVERSQAVTNGLAPGQNPGGMWPHFSDPNFGKPFMMLNMYLATHATVRLFHDGDCASSLGVPVMIEPSLEGWQAEYDDVDLDADWLLLQQTSDNVRDACAAIHTTPPPPSPPRNVPLGCGFL